MDIRLEDFRNHYSMLSDEALLEIDPADLVDAAKTCLAEEKTARGLDAGEAEDTNTGEAEPNPQELVPVAEFTVMEEARYARTLLLGERIVAYLGNENSLIGNRLWTPDLGPLKLMVPADAEEEALAILGSEISDEELAAQAEAAGQVEVGESEEDFGEEEK